MNASPDSRPAAPTGLLRELALLARHRGPVLLVVGAVTVAAIVYSLVTEKRYEAHASLLPAGEESGGAFGGMAALLSSLPIQGANLPGVTTSTDLLSGLIRTRRIQEPLVREFDLITRYKADHLDAALLTFDQNLSTGIGDEGMLHIRFQDRDPEFAATIANRLVDDLNRYSVEVSSTKSRLHREFLEQRVAATATQLAAAEDELAEYQRTHAIPLVDERAAAAADAMGSLLARKYTLEIEMEALSQFLDSGSPPIQQRQVELDALTREVEEMPDIGFGAIRLYRDLKVQEQIYLLLNAQLEQARISENRDLPQVQIVDHATAPALRAWPKRKLIVIAAFVMASALALLLAHALDYMERERATIRAAFASNRE